MKKIKITEQQARLLGLKPKNLLKITKEQYNRIFASGAINEEINRVDKSFKKAFVGKDIENLKETDFDIKKPNTSIPTSAQGRFGQDMIENEVGNDTEVKELIAYLYRKTDEYPQSLVDKGLTYDEVCDALMSKNIIIDDNGKYLLSKSLGSPENAIKAVQDELNSLTGGSVEEPAEEPLEAPIEEPELETEDAGGYPTGADMDPRAPWRGDDPVLPFEKKSSAPRFKIIALNDDIAIVDGIRSGDKYVFYFNDAPKYLEDVASMNTYLNTEKIKIGNGIEGWKNDDEFIKIDDALKNELVALYDKDAKIVSALGDISEGEGVMDKFKTNIKKSFTPDPSKPEKSPEELQKIKDKLELIRAKELKRRAADDNVEETTSAASSGAFTGPLSGPIVSREMPVDTNDLNVPIVKEFELGKGYTHFAINKTNGKIVTGWDYKGLEKEDIKHYSTTDLKSDFPGVKLSDFKVVTKASLMKNGIDTSDTNNWVKTNENTLTETTSGSDSMGAYDANALQGINRDGSFKKTKKTKAQKKTQYAGGSFVEMGGCTKMDNKPAGSGCSQGAVDGVVKLKKTSSNINAPSLGGGKS